MPAFAKSLTELFREANVFDLRGELTMGPCRLLKESVASKQNNTTQQFLRTLSDCQHLLATDKLSESFKVWTQILDKGKPASRLWLDCKPMIKARLNLITTILGDSEREEIETAIRKLVDCVTEHWKYHPTSQTIALNQACAEQSESLHPSFFPFTEPNPPQSELPEIMKAVRSVASDKAIGWSHPGFSMAGEMIAEILGCRREPELTVQTKIMLAADHPESPQGLLAKLSFQRIANGCGLLIPDPYTNANLHMQQSFSNGLQSAWQAARDFADKSFGLIQPDRQFDWRWSIDLLSATQSLSAKPIQIRLDGRSGEVAFACGLFACDPRNPDNDGDMDPLDLNVGVTAALGETNSKGERTTTGVGQVKIKTLVGRVKAERMMEIVISDKQNPNELPQPNEDARFEFREAKTLGESYQYLTRHPRITRGVNRFLARSADDDLKKACPITTQDGISTGGYIEPEIVEVIEKDRRVGEDIDIRSKEAITEPLSEEQFRCLVQGKTNRISDLHYRPNQDNNSSENGEWEADSERSPAGSFNRIRIFADSGLGKSVFVLYCQKHIAESGANLLPLRMGRTTGKDATLNIKWNAGSFEEVATKLSQLPGISSAFDRYLDRLADQTTIDDLSRSEWFEWMLKKGRVVFLIDAIDQADETLTGMGTFLGSQLIRNCPVVVTGRPESLNNRSQAFQENDWRTFKMEPFDRDRQEKYLGRWLSRELLVLKGDEKIHAFSSRHGFRCHQWQELLQVPLLLSMIKELAESNVGHEKSRLHEIESRFELYELAVEHLIDKGWKSASHDQKELLIDKDEIIETLSEIAWHMVWHPSETGTESAHNFSNMIEGKAMKSLREKLDPKRRKANALLKALEQVDLTTAYQVLDRADSSGLAFRHRSFLEFFFAWRLTTAETKKEIREQLFSEIQCSIDENGNLLENLLPRWGDWQDTLRFALSCHNQQKRNEIARELISHGNPWIVYQAIKRDNAAFDEGVESLTRWLVHRDMANWFDYHSAIRESAMPKSEVKKSASEQFALGTVDATKMLDRRFRESAYLFSMREVLNVDCLYETTSHESGLLERMRHLGDSNENKEWNFFDTFVPVYAGTFDAKKYHPDLGIESVAIDEFSLADFPVTNQLYEVFDPNHARFRDPYGGSKSPDDPVVHVSWFMAVEFCEWLSYLTQTLYRLPSEWEWEWACRWHDTRQDQYWWGPDMNDRLFWSVDTDNKPRSRSSALLSTSMLGLPHPSVESNVNLGILDLSGNVWEWCRNGGNGLYFPSPTRAVRGKKSSYRFELEPYTRGWNAGFRVCRIPE